LRAQAGEQAQKILLLVANQAGRKGHGGRAGWRAVLGRELELDQLNFEVEAEMALACVAIEECDFVMDDPGVANVLAEIDDLLVGAAESRIVGESFDNLVSFVDAFRYWKLYCSI